MSKQSQLEKALTGRPRTSKPRPGASIGPKPDGVRRTAERTAVAQIATIIDQASRAQPVNHVVAHNGDTIVDKHLSPKAGLGGYLSFGAPIGKLVDRDGRVLHSPVAKMAGESISLSLAAAKTSRVLSAGAHLLEVPAAPQSVKGLDFPAFPMRRLEFSTIEPAAFSLVDTESELEVENTVQITELAGASAAWDPDAMSHRAIRVQVSRKERLGDRPEIIAGRIMLAITQGIGRAIDAELMTALTATSPAQFDLGAAAALGVDVNELCAICGTGAAAADMAIENGQPYYRGVPVRLSPDLAGNLVAAWNRFAVVVDPDIRLLATRMDATGKVELVAWLALQALVPDDNFVWATA